MMCTHANRYMTCSRTLKKLKAIKLNSFVGVTACVSLNLDKLTITCTDQNLISLPRRFLSGYNFIKPSETVSSFACAQNIKAGHIRIWTRSEPDLPSQRRNYSTHRHRRSRTGKKEENLYDVLGLTPKTTQAQIKAAYYKLSKIYHPDKHQNVDNAEADKGSLAQNQAKFNEISEAYKVLGNTLMRRRYDRGILSPHDTPESVKRHEASVRDDRSVYRPVSDQRIYDFDAFYQKHYGESIARERRARAERIEMEAQYAKQLKDADKYNWLPKSMLFIGILGAAFYFYQEKNQDKWKKVVKNRKY